MYIGTLLATAFPIFMVALMYLVARLHRRTVNSLRDEIAFGQALFDGSPDPTLVLDQQGNILQINVAAEQCFGFARSQALGASLAALFDVKSKVAPEHVLGPLLHPGSPRGGCWSDCLGCTTTGTSF